MLTKHMFVILTCIYLKVEVLCRYNRYKTHSRFSTNCSKADDMLQFFFVRQWRPSTHIEEL